MPRPRKFKEGYVATFRIERAAWERFKEFCSGKELDPGSMLRKFIDAVLRGESDIRMEGSSFIVNAPLSISVAKAEAKARSSVDVYNVALIEQLKDLVERAHKLVEREKRITATGLQARTSELKERLRGQILDTLKRKPKLSKRQLEEVRAALNLLKG